MVMGTDEDGSSPPLITIRWLRPTMSTPYLQLPTAPITASTVDTWIALTEEESLECENTWNALSDEERTAAALASEGCGSKGHHRSGSSEDDEDSVGITIFDDKLFEVDVKSMELRPIYWRSNGPEIKVRRATWMYDETRPVPNHLAHQLDAAYRTVQPWQTSYKLELETAAQIGLNAYEKLKYPLKPVEKGENSASQQFLIFEDALTARITSGNTSPLFSSSFFSNRSSKPSTIPFTGTLIYYGFDAALASHTPRPLTSSRTDDAKDSASALTNTIGVSINEDSRETQFVSNEYSKFSKHVGDEGPRKVADLILIVHGIGQGLATQYESWSFLYAVNYFRQVAKKQSTLPSLASIMRNKQVQFLPIEWRTILKLGDEEQREREREGLDNSFSIADVTPKRSIPAVRQMFNDVLIEIPYFMSSHQTAMIQSVCTQANRTYRLWCARNPGFDKYGRVHIIGHSLGSVLSAYILSKQPTYQPSLSKMTPQQLSQCHDTFLFNTSTLFTFGSPLAVFVHLNQAQIIARKGRQRTKESPPDEALDRSVFGCFAVDSVYNVFHPSDPVAYLLNPCVDSEAAINLPPSTIPTFSASVMSGLSQRVSRILGDVMPRSFGASPHSSRANSPARRPNVGRAAPSTFELSGSTHRAEGSRAERRFAALNPHGSVDFQLHSEGNLSEYVDMLTAHSSYWQDPDLAAFILVELFASELDLARTGLVPEAKSRV